MRNDRYVLNGRVPVVEPDLIRWANWFETAERRVAHTEVPGGRVSTVFLGLDHNFSSQGPPLLFESMSFIDGRDDEQERYATWEQAEAGHRAMVELVTNGNTDHD